MQQATPWRLNIAHNKAPLLPVLDSPRFKLRHLAVFIDRNYEAGVVDEKTVAAGTAILCVTGADQMVGGAFFEDGIISFHRPEYQLGPTHGGPDLAIRIKVRYPVFTEGEDLNERRVIDEVRETSGQEYEHLPAYFALYIS